MKGVLEVDNHRLHLLARGGRMEKGDRVLEHLLDAREDHSLRDLGTAVDLRPPEVHDEAYLEAPVLAGLEDARQLRDDHPPELGDHLPPGPDVNGIARLDRPLQLRQRVHPRLLERLVVAAHDRVRQDAQGVVRPRLR